MITQPQPEPLCVYLQFFKLLLMSAIFSLCSCMSFRLNLMPVLLQCWHFNEPLLLSLDKAIWAHIYTTSVGLEFNQDKQLFRRSLNLVSWAFFSCQFHARAAFTIIVFYRSHKSLFSMQNVSLQFPQIDREKNILQIYLVFLFNLKSSTRI